MGGRSSPNTPAVDRHRFHRLTFGSGAHAVLLQRDGEGAAYQRLRRPGRATETGAAGMEDRTAGVGRLGKVVNVTCALLSYDAAAALQ